MTPVCPYCEMPAILVKGDRVYPHRPDLAELNFWLCGPCDAYVGCHKVGAWSWREGVRYQSDGTLPLGRLANPELRRAKSALHAALDPLWRDTPGPWKAAADARSRVYAELAKRMRMSKDECHIGLFGLEECHRAMPHVRDMIKRYRVDRSPHNS